LRKLHTTALIIELGRRSIEGFRNGAFVRIQIRVEISILRVFAVIRLLVNLINGGIFVVTAFRGGWSVVLSLAFFAVLAALRLARVKTLDLCKSVVLFVAVSAEETGDCD